MHLKQGTIYSDIKDIISGYTMQNNLPNEIAAWMVLNVSVLVYRIPFLTFWSRGNNYENSSSNLFCSQHFDDTQVS